MLAKSVPAFADRGCCIVSTADSYGRNLGFLDRAFAHVRNIQEFCVGQNDIRLQFVVGVVLSKRLVLEHGILQLRLLLCSSINNQIRSSYSAAHKSDPAAA
jgi:hypothetical protein